MDLTARRSQLHQRVRLTFHDGEVVDATLLGLDPIHHQDLTYEVLAVIRHGEPPARGTAIGATCIAGSGELRAWAVSTNR